MNKVFTFFFSLIISCSIFGQEDIAGGVKSFLKDYEAVLNNLSDPEHSLNERKLFREDILDIYFIRGETMVFNHLNEEGSRILKGKEYLENLTLDYDLRIRHELVVDENMDFDIKSSTFTVPVTHIMQTDDWTKTSHLQYIIKWYSDRRPDIISILSGEEDWVNRKEATAFAEAEGKHTVDSYQSYLNAYPNGEFSEEAREAISALQEEKAWVEAGEENTAIAYQHYIDTYPEGNYVSIAKEKIKELQEIARYNRLPASIKDLVDNMITVEEGSFTMGCTSEQDLCFEDELDLKTVKVDSFLIGIHEVTQAQWKAIMGNAPGYFEGCEDCPVEQVSWNEVQEFIRRLNELTGDTYRLPTEEEWEYAARGGNKSKNYRYAGGNDIMQVALFAGNSLYQLSTATKQPNELGIHDMSGSVYEWCRDDYMGLQNRDTELKVIRGGAWNSDKRYCRVSNRFWMAPDSKMDNIGFRLVRNL